MQVTLRPGARDAAPDGQVIAGGVPYPAAPGTVAVSSGADALVVCRQLERLRVEADVTPGARGVLDVRYAIVDRPLVSVIIPTRGGGGQVHGRHRVFVVEAVRF